MSQLLFQQDRVQIQDLSEISSKVFSHFNGNKIILCLSGDLGAGKTEFVKNFCRQLGITDVSSPSFALIQQYENSKFHIDHIDLYRIESEDELESIGFWDIFQKQQGIVIIEWPERINLQYLPKDWTIYILNIDKSAEVYRSFSLRSL